MVWRKQTRLYRYLQSADCHGMKITFSFIDEYGKITVAKYKSVGMIKGHLSDNFVWKLDGRSIRYMRRKRIIENKKPKLIEL